MRWIKNIRLIGLIVLVLMASFFLIIPQLTKTRGVIVTSVGTNTPCKEVITVGSIITEIGGRKIVDSNDFNQVVKKLKGPITLIINNNPRSCTIPENSTLDVTVKNIRTISGLKFGIEIGGGTRFLLKPETNVSSPILEQTLESLKLRMKKYDLSNSKVELTDDNLIQILTGFEEEEYIRHIIERGELEGGLEFTVELEDRNGEFVFNDKIYEITSKDTKRISINTSEYELDQWFTLDDVELQVENVSMNSTTFFAKIFDDKDLTISEETQVGGTSTRIIKQDSGYVFTISVLLSEEASSNFVKTTKGQEVVINPNTGESLLKSPIIIKIDGIPVVNLPVSGADIGKEKKDMIIWTYKTTLNEATDDMLKLKSIIESKRLPTKLTVLETSKFSPEVNEFFISLPIYTISIVSIALPILFFIRYRKRGVMVLPLILLCLSEILLILGTMASQWFVILIFLFGVGFVLVKGEGQGWISWLSIFFMFIIVVGIVMSKWVLDTSSIIGLSVVMIFSVIQGIIIGDKILSGKEVFKQSSRLFWILTMIVAGVLFGLFFINVFRGFIMAVTVGILISTTITKPVYNTMISRWSK